MSLVELSMKVCLNEWRNVFLNYEAACHIRFPEPRIIIGLISYLVNKISFRDIKGLCLCMMEYSSDKLSESMETEQPNISADNTKPEHWLSLLFYIKKSYASPEYYDLIHTICNKIEKKRTVKEWVDFFVLATRYQEEPDLELLYAIRNKIIADDYLTQLLLKLPTYNMTAIKLICEFKLVACVPKLISDFSLEIDALNKGTLVKKNYFQTDFEKWKITAATFEEVAEFVYESENCALIKSVLCQVANYNAQEGSAAKKYYDYLKTQPASYLEAIDENITLQLNQELLEFLSQILSTRSYVNSNRVKMAYRINPVNVLNSLYYNDIQTTKWCKLEDKKNTSPSFVLQGVVSPLEEFTQDDFRNIVRSNWAELAQEFLGDLRNISIYSYQHKIIGQLDKLFEKQNDDWKLDPVIHQIYNVYSRVKATSLAKYWKRLIEFLPIFSTVTVEKLVYSGVPTCRSCITVSNINIDVLSKIYPTVVANSLYDISNTYWANEENSYLEYTSYISAEVYNLLNNYKENLSYLGLNLEDLAVRRATERFYELEKSINRQINTKNTNYARDSKWQELLNSAEASTNGNRYRLSVIINNLDVLNNLQILKKEVQISHIKNISYLASGYELDWTCDNLFTYIAPKIVVNKKFETLLNNSGFKLEVINNTEKPFLRVTGVYNNYNYLPSNSILPETFLDDKPLIPLEKNYSKNLQKKLNELIVNAKVSIQVKGQISVALMRARTYLPDGSLNAATVSALEVLVKSINKPEQIACFKEELKKLLGNATLDD